MSTAGGGREKKSALRFKEWDLVSYTKVQFFLRSDKMFFIQLDKNLLKIQRFV